MIDHGAEALASLEDALAAYRQLGDRRAEGAALCRLSRILWCPGRLAESDAAGARRWWCSRRCPRARSSAWPT